MTGSLEMWKRGGGCQLGESGDGSLRIDPSTNPGLLIRGLLAVSWITMMVKRDVVISSASLEVFQ
jgi:hypothetical protein